MFVFAKSEIAARKETIPYAKEKAVGYRDYAMRNNYGDNTPDATFHLANQIKTVVGSDPTTWGLTATQMTLLSSAANALGNDNASVLATRQAAKAATQGRASSDKDCKAAIAGIAASVYANKGLSPSQIASLGFQPRKTTKTKVVPVTPTGLVAAIERNGNVRLTFGRAGNAAGVIFRVEAQSTANGVWSFVTETTATRLSLSGYAPGEWTAFRIVATKNGIDAPASDTAVIYASGASVEAAPTLRLAA